MYIVIIGGGKVGAEAARELVESGHEVTVIERRSDRANDLNEELGEITMVGDGTEVRIQAEAGMNRADLVVAATGRDEANLAAAQVAKHRFGTPRVIARVNFPRNAEIFRMLGRGYDGVGDAGNSVAYRARAPEPPGDPFAWSLHASDYELVEVMVSDDATTIGSTVGSLQLPSESLLSLIVHGDGRPEVPNDETVIDAGAALLGGNVAGA